MKEARISTVLRRGGKPRRTLACFLLSAATLLLGSHSSGQESLEAGGVHPPIDRQLSRGIARAAEGLAAGQYAQSLRFLDEALSRKDDYFVDVHQQGEFVGLKELARRMIRELPPEGREIYESTYGPTARRLLNAAVKSGDVAALQAIVERFFETSAGREAALLLAREQADSGKRLSAALLLDRLLDSPQARTELEPQLSFQAAAAFVATGQEQRARDVLAEAAQRGAAVEIAGEKLAVSNRAAAEDWIDHLTTDLQPNSAAGPREWVSARGGENDADGGGLPHRRVRWKVRLLTHPKLEEKLAEIAADQRSTGSAAPVAAAPLAVGNVVLVRTVDCMLAVDFTTGKRIWRSQPQREPQIELLIAPQGGAPGDVADLGPLRALSRRTWDDCLYAALSSDGQRVYVLRDLAMPAQATYEMWQGPLSVGGREASGVVNRLCAYDLATQGKLIWEIDGATEGPLQGAFFLGVPSAAGTTLYALAEIKNRIYLTALDGAAGSVEWMQQLVDVETGVNQNLQRRLQAQTPAYDSGMLVCTTGTGIVVGVDAAQHSLAWAYRYPSTPTATAVYEPTPEDGRTGQDRWLDAGVTLAAGKVLLTPPESQSIHCLDLRTGKLLWKAPRGAMRRLEGVEGDVALLSGPRSLRALKVADGSPAWPAELLLGRDESISGTGFFSAGRCYLPLSTGSVIAVDAASGSIAARVGSHDGEALGNLVCHRGAVLSSNGLTLDRFDQVESLKRAAERRLAKNPAHVPSLTTMGEIAFNEGRLSEAVDLLVRAYRLDPTDVDVGESLSECLTEALDQNFAAFRQHLGVLSELGRNDPATRVNLLRLQSQGQLAEGEWLDSAKAALELSHLIRNGDEPLVIGRSHQTTIARWVQSQLLAIRDRADAATWKTIDELVDSAAASTAESPAERLRDLVACFGDLPGREGLKLSWASRLQADGRAVEAQQLLLDLAESPSAAIRCEALGRLSLQLHEAGQHQLAAGFDRELAGPLADVATSAGEKGAALAVRFAAAQGAEPIVWPQGVVETSTQMLTRTDGMRMHAPLWGLRWERTDPTLAGLTAMISARGGELILIDSLGRELFNRPLEQQNMIHYRQPGSMYAAARGSLMVVSLGRQIAAVSTLPNAPDAGQALLWRADVAASIDAQGGYVPEAPSTAVRPGSYRAPRSTIDGQWVGVLGPISSRGVVYQDQRRLLCVDAATGAVAWSRNDVDSGGDLFGDSRRVIAAVRDSTKARAFDAVDGRLLGEVSVPPWSEQLATLGSRVVRWTPISGGRRELACYDPLSGKDDWRREFARNSCVDVDQNRFVAVVEPSGKTVILDAQSNEPLVEAELARAPRMEEVHLAVGSDRIRLVVDVEGRSSPERQIRPLMMVDSAVVHGQMAMFDRATGKSLWRRPVDVAEQSLLLTQPVDLPIIVFAGTLNTRDRSGTRAETSMLVLDARTGRSLFKSDSLPQAAAGHCMAHLEGPPEEHALAIDLAGRSVLLRFTDDPRPPEPPSMAEVETEIPAGGGGILGILRSLGVGGPQ